MKTINLFTSLLLVPCLSWGSICSQGTSMGKQWQEQKNWKETTLKPSDTNPELQIAAYIDKDQHIYLKPIEVRGAYKATMDINIKSIYQPKRFIEYCANSKTYGSILTTAREDESNQNQFRIVLNYLPSPSLLKKNPYQQQKFTTDPNGIGVVMNLREDSLVKKSESWIFKQDLGKQLAQKISQDLQQQLAQGVTGSATLVLDGMDDLACDLLKGQAQIRFFHSGNMEDAKTQVLEEVQTDDLWNLYDQLDRILSHLKNKDERLFAAGATWMQNSESLESLGQDSRRIFRIISQMSDFQSPTVMKSISENEMECLAANESKFKRGQYNSLVSLEVSTQSLTDLMKAE
jgi:hypothetical protein